jgi:ribosomal protein S18 acetylase RimI-like enzyme
MITLRPATDADLPFLERLYGTTRAMELEQVPWTDEQKAAFVAHQFAAQHDYWHQHYADTSWDVIEEDGVPVGRLYVSRWKNEIRIVDIALMPEMRSRGIGSRLMEALFEEGDRRGVPVTIHVEVYNPARRLYQRLGFVEVGQHGDVYLRMERPPR